MKSPIKAVLSTFDEEGNNLAKPIKLFCHFASGEPVKVIEVWLENGDVNKSILIDFKSLMKEVKKHDANK